MPAPARPLDDVDLSAVKMAKVTQDDLKDFAETAKLFECVPEPGYFGIKREFKNGGGKVYFGGERKALTVRETFKYLTQIAILKSRVSGSRKTLGVRGQGVSRGLIFTESTRP